MSLLACDPKQDYLIFSVSLVLGRGIPTRAAPGEVSNEPNVSVAPSLPALSKGGLPTPTTQQGPARQRRQPAPCALFVSTRSLTALASLSLPTALSDAVKQSASWGYPNASSGLMPVVQQPSAKAAHSVCKCSLVIALEGGGFLTFASWAITKMTHFGVDPSGARTRAPNEEVHVR